MVVKLSLTTKCNARCQTCPCWTYEGQDIPVESFRAFWKELQEHPMVDRILLNNTGDLFNHSAKDEILAIIAGYRRRYTIMTTNAGLMDTVPAIDELVISFNGGTKETYESTTGLSFEKTVKNVKALYPQIALLPNAEIHCLIWEGNQGTEGALLELWKDFPGRVRVSYKYDNQGGEDRTLEAYRADKRTVCDYLRMLCVMPDGTVAMCAHDWEMTERWGNVFTDGLAAPYNHPRRVEKIREHLRFRYTGVCAGCNYNTPAEGRVRYIKERAA